MLSSWPVTGTLDYIRQPRLWGWPLVTTAAGWTIILLVFAWVLAWQRPAHDIGFWSTLVGYLWALAKAGGAALAIYLLILPVLVGLACEQLAKRVQRAAGAPEAREEPLHRAVWSTGRVILNTLHLRLLWLGVSIVALLITGPFGLVVGAFAMAQIAVIDAADIGLAMRGCDGLTRIRLLAAHRAELRRAALPAAGLNIALGVTFLGWLFWLPGLVTGAARLVLDWPEVRALDGPRASTRIVPAVGATPEGEVKVVDAELLPREPRE
jgi:hypothetical protein